MNTSSAPCGANYLINGRFSLPHSATGGRNPQPSVPRLQPEPGDEHEPNQPYRRPRGRAQAAQDPVREPEPTVPAKPPAPTFRELVEGPWKEAHFDGYKPSTQKATRLLLERRILPAFGATPLDRIAPADVGRWFDDYSRTAPGGANRALEILHQILNFAVARGHVETNPARGVKRNRRPALTRFLSRDEIARLHRALYGHAERGSESRKQADIIRLLLFTGCRLGEIVRLRRSEVVGDTLMLTDRKTGLFFDLYSEHALSYADGP